ncbi:MAG: adenylate/guanylate cyclase domain-containing protein [Proteobacteria bacterium]|nr:adenylate/guanylate cyclase domain-containing protein [Pseudomonadota bacterium]MBI3499048.1 adenylate/guanylate cyclase domain-containing protein [Pseudomonadota bacterium]
MAPDMAVATPLAASGRAEPALLEWLLREGPRIESPGELLFELCNRLLAAGVPLMRATCTVRTLHPTLIGTTMIWRKGEDWPTEIGLLHGIEETQQFKESPLPAIYEGAAAIRRRLDIPGAVLDYPILADLKAEGATDYVALPLVFSDGLINFLTWTSDRPGGFTTQHLKVLYDLMPVLALVLETRARQVMTTTLLTTYLGGDAGRRVLEGAIRRGNGETIRAVIWLCDLRGFTAMSDALPRDTLIAVLNDYFERMVLAVEGQGGEVLKFMGDGLLAIFPIDGEAKHAATAALAAAADAQTRMARLAEERRAKGKAELRFGLALHVGDLIYGNIGSRRRLDFTVIGPSVNMASRIEALTKVLRRAVLASAEFAEVYQGPLTSLGFHVLRGFTEPVEIFTLPEDVPEPGYG